MEDLDDDTGAIQDFGAGSPLQVADLAGRKLVVDDDEPGLGGGVRFGLRRDDGPSALHVGRTNPGVHPPWTLPFLGRNEIMLEVHG